MSEQNKTNKAPTVDSRLFYEMCQFYHNADLSKCDGDDAYRRLVKFIDYEQQRSLLALRDGLLALAERYSDEWCDHVFSQNAICEACAEKHAIASELRQFIAEKLGDDK